MHPAHTPINTCRLHNHRRLALPDPSVTLDRAGVALSGTGTELYVTSVKLSGGDVALYGASVELPGAGVVLYDASVERYARGKSQKA